MRRKIFAVVTILIAILISVSLLTTACAKQPSEQQPITIGAVIPLTGFIQDPGKCHQQGYELALDQAPKEIAGRPLRFILEDEASDPAVAMDKTRKLIETDKACMILGPLHSGAILGIQDYLAKMKVPSLPWYRTSDQTALAVPWVWQIVGTMAQGTCQMGAYAYDKLGYRTMTTLTMDYSAGHEFMGGCVQAFKDRGGTIVQEQLYPPPTVDFAPYIKALQQADAVCSWTSFGPAQMGYLRQLKEFGVTMPNIAAEGQPEASYCLKSYGDLVLGWPYATTYVWTIDTPENKNFLEAFKKKYNGDLPGPMAVTGYTNVMIALEVLKKTGGNTSGDVIAKALDELKINTPMGPISFKDRLSSVPYRVAVVEKVGNDYIPKVLATYNVEAKMTSNSITYISTLVQ